MNVLLLGSGGREHAIACSIAASKQCSQLFVAPGNAGTALLKLSSNKSAVTNVAISPTDFPAIKDFCVANNINMVVVGPEAPLVAGIRDYFESQPSLRKVMVIGPSKVCAQLEGSKDYAKAFMQRHNIPTAAYRTFTTASLKKGIAFLHTLKPPYVLKADGLAAGKGVLILPTLEEAERELTAMLKDAKFGEASAKVVVEEYLDGIELSVFVLSDGKHYKILPTAKDYKRIGEGDTGLNTGGMGSVSPVHFADKQFMKKVEERIVVPTVKGLYQEGTPYKGFIFVGLMAVTNEATGELDPYVIEYNVRMGDPETESVFPRIKSDMVDLLERVWRGNLQQTTLEIDPRTAACVMAVAGGYPGSYEKGHPITGIDQVEGSMVFHAGTRIGNDGQMLTNGGRVLCVTTLADSMPEALLRSYQEMAKITWQGIYYRRDIGQDLLKMIVAKGEN
ncbi:MAG: phosphoribosylamine--glycine ligase [Bacteroidales bacterium]|nr:phosphoribosylamine--glycine ligase [Bacteroidales bacterium]